MNEPLSTSNSHVTVIGSGIVGLSCAHFLSRNGFQVNVIDRNLTGDRASFGNAGAIAFSEVMPIAAPGIAWKVPYYLCKRLGPLSIDPTYIWLLWPYLRRFLKSANKSQYETSAKSMARLLSSAFEDHQTIHKDTGLGHLLNKSGHLWVYRSEKYRNRSIDWIVRRRLGYDFEFLNRNGALLRINCCL